MPWLIVALISYLMLAITVLGDKFFLVGPIASAKIYTFYIGILQIFVLAAIPFVNFAVPEPFQIFLSLSSGICFIFGLFWLYKGLRIFEASRVVPTVGGLLPLFIFFTVLILSRGQTSLNAKEFLAFILLISGSVFITYHKGTKKISFATLKYAALGAGFLALYFVLAKYVYLAQPFWSGFIWIRMGSFLTALFFLLLFRHEILSEVFKKNQISASKKMTALFFLNQGLGSAANILQNWAIALAPLAYVAIVSALQGVQYVFVLIFAIFISFKFPLILKEEISRGAISQKIIAILLIGAGLAILAI